MGEILLISCIFGKPKIKEDWDLIFTQILAKQLIKEFNYFYQVELIDKSNLVNNWYHILRNLMSLDKILLFNLNS